MCLKKLPTVRVTLQKHPLKRGFEFSPVVFPGFLRLPVSVLAGEHAAGRNSSEKLTRVVQKVFFSTSHGQSLCRNG